MLYCLLKVITFHEPLKPFIVIVVEVTVLVAAILLCEKCRSKNTSSEGISHRIMCCVYSPYLTYSVCLCALLFFHPDDLVMDDLVIQETNKPTHCEYTAMAFTFLKVVCLPLFTVCIFMSSSGHREKIMDQREALQSDSGKFKDSCQQTQAF